MVKDGEILFDQSVRYKDLTAPAADYAKVQSFFDRFAGAQRRRGRAHPEVSHSFCRSDPI